MYYCQQYHNPFLDIEAIDDDDDEEGSDDAEMDQFIARDDEVDGTECSRRVHSPAVMREHVKSTYLTDVIRRWDLESDGYTTEHGSVRRHCFHSGALVYVCSSRNPPHL